MAGKKKQLRLQIAQEIGEPVAPIEQRIADVLKKKGEYRGYLTCDQLAVIMRKVLFTLVAEQKVGGFDVPIVHNVSAMDVTIAGREANVFAEIHVHSPINAFIQFRYCLENAPGNLSKKLHLKNNRVDVREITRPFDFPAKAALKIMGVKHIALRELSNPNAVIQRTLPPQLEPHGFRGALTQVELALTDDDTMQVYVACERDA
jgi:hypothetical protein